MLRDPHRNYEDIGVAGPVVHQEADGTFRMWYSAIGTRWGFYSICCAESDDGIHWRRGAQVGDHLQLAPTGNGWEKQMVESPTIIRAGDHPRLFYCGNGCGQTGIGTAVSKKMMIVRRISSRSANITCNVVMSSRIPPIPRPVPGPP